jgi:hypothetical protein
VGPADGSFTQRAFTVDNLREEVADLTERGAVFLDFDTCSNGARPPNDVANVATFLASDWAKTMTAADVNLPGGAVFDENPR